MKKIIVLGLSCLLGVSLQGSGGVNEEFGEVLHGIIKDKKAIQTLKDYYDVYGKKGSLFDKIDNKSPGAFVMLNCNIEDDECGDRVCDIIEICLDHEDDAEGAVKKIIDYYVTKSGMGYTVGFTFFDVILKKAEELGINIDVDSLEFDATSDNYEAGKKIGTWLNEQYDPMNENVLRALYGVDAYRAHPFMDATRVRHVGDWMEAHMPGMQSLSDTPENIAELILHCTQDTARHSELKTFIGAAKLGDDTRVFDIDKMAYNGGQLGDHWNTLDDKLYPYKRAVLGELDLRSNDPERRLIELCKEAIKYKSKFQAF